MVELQTNVYNLRDYPGTFEAVNAEMNEYVAQAQALLGFDFRFQ
jgi:hypothetical protein